MEPHSLLPELGRRHLKSVSRRALFAVSGALLAPAAPLGLLLAHSLRLGLTPSPAHMFSLVAADPVTYGYVLLSTLIAFVALGYWLGSREDLLERRSHSDALTGLANRRLFYVRLHEEFARAQRYHTALSLLLIDVDHLKPINDRRGHAAGDAALCLVGDTLRLTSRAADLPSRYGGDEFAVLAPLTSANEAMELANRVRQRLASLSARSGEAPLTVSIGVADLLTSSALMANDLLAAADEALYIAKASGRDRVVLAMDVRTPSYLRPPMSLVPTSIERARG